MSNELPGNILPQIIGDNRRDITVATSTRWVGRLVDRFSVAIHVAAYGSRPINIPLPPDLALNAAQENARELLISIYCASRWLSKPRESGKMFPRGVHLETRREIFTRSKARGTEKYA